MKTVTEKGDMYLFNIRSHLKIIFWPNLGVGDSF